ncbi:hypothetical protein ACFU5P_17930 [Streptomyces sp. NPDC057433]|uniref:hypothetical protein n=1 Tax=Streptomyces sp. NPDC057433 TaxID=3346132 RepID=UPI00369FB59A
MASVTAASSMGRRCSRSPSTRGDDAVTARTHALQDADDDPAAPAAVCKDLVGRRILTDQGAEMGTFQDTDTGAVLIVRGVNDHHPGAAPTGIGSYALLITTRS